MARTRLTAPGGTPDVEAAPAGRGSLFSEMLDWMLAPFLLVWPLSVALTYLIGISLANEAFDRSLASKTRALAEQAVWVPERGMVRLTADLRTLLADDDTDAHFIRIDSANGSFLLGEPELPSLPLDQLREGGQVAFRTLDFRDSSVRIAALKHLRDSGNSPAGTPIIVYVAESTEKRTALAREIMKGIVFPQLLMVPLMVLLMWLGLRRGAAPLERLRAQVMARATDDVRPLQAPDAPEEVAPLINAFNDLLARVEHEGAAQKRFIANAAHQLRTPLAGIKMQTELALRSADLPDKTEALNRIAAGTARTAHLINQLLALARTEGAAADSLPMSATDLGSIARDMVSAAYPFACRKHIDLGFDAPDRPVMIRGHTDLLRELVNNLVDNAIRYTPEKGHITVRVLELDTPALEIEDDGIGIPPAERELVFERFYRVVGGQEAGSGIGLAIVREIALRHGASVMITAPSGGVGSLFRVAFPRAESGTNPAK
ncbi:MAG: sensor histidine kinase N-terminal domain-containing protein [Betaproteobacteria bacterium]